ncbi:apoptosis regulator BAX [Onychostoma macrolepis]|uniref:Bcl-2 Bcl-2 homology region 1-3 domain-containing protein n=1 Tax=Onychostoma macrolepis TaxID=369639 RepID=A0A7J6D9W5_9TELE|nr:apoptosis regulator BAX [Onychostoma macrolepis]KAF4116096.1 hypothetical protein G5714_003585 [Onychostoma macrolepis]
MSAEREQLLDQVANVIRVFGDSLDQEPRFNDLVDGFARVADRQSFQMLVDKVFVGGITWGKIITLICVIGKTVAKILANSVPSIVSWTLDYFRDYLQNWICSRGGWPDLPLFWSHLPQWSTAGWPHRLETKQRCLRTVSGGPIK